MRKIGIVGAFGFCALEETTGGQPVKTRTLYYALCRHYGDQSIKFVETYKWKKNPLKMLIQLICVIFSCSIIILLPAQNGIGIFLNILLRCKRKTTKIYYDVIGGWIAEKARGDVTLQRQLKRIDGIWVETTSMKNDLSALGINNTVVIPNFKDIKSLRYEDLKTIEGEKNSYRFCTFSRVMEEKGISDAISAVKRINAESNRSIVSLDIYGPVDESYKNKFEQMIFGEEKTIKYKGIVDPSMSVETVRQYDALLFPTRYYTEGIPGTIIDAYSAGVPIMTSLWVNSGDVFWEGETGWGYAFDDKDGIYNLIVRFIENPSSFFAMKRSCLDKSKLFSSEYVARKIVDILENG